MASKAANKRLSKEYVTMQKEPPPFVWAVPDEKDILIWNFIIHGPPDSPYVGGEYHGVLLFPSEYPFKPPGIKMYTPSGRFQPDKKICFSMSDFHPGSWNPAWSVATILTGLVSFMLSDEMTTGSVTTTDADKECMLAGVMLGTCSSGGSGIVFLSIARITSIPAEHGRERTWHARHIRTYARTFRQYTDGALTPNTYAEGRTRSPISSGRSKDRGCCTPTEGTCCLHDRSGRWQSWLGRHVARGRVGQMALGCPYRFGRGRFSYHDEHL
ncbi:ubiquitin-conjugating enzyme/RWD-like protein, partial [Russula vinacea]